MCFFGSHQIGHLSLDRKGILILNNNKRSLKFGSSATFELSPWGEKKKPQLDFFFTTLFRGVEGMRITF